MGEVFGSLAYEYTLPKAIKEGYLSPIKALTIPLKLDLSGVSIQSGDLKAGDVATALDPYLYQIADEMKKYCTDRKTVVFLPLVKTSRKFRDILTERGFKAAEVNGESRDRLERQIRDRGLEREVTLTGFVENAERNALYRYCRAFLFPSVFEGFGMPTVEAMLFGTVVIATDRTCIPEVTQGKANYVKDPYNVEEWIRVMQNPVDKIAEVDFSQYDQMKLSRKYFDLLQKYLA